MLDVLNFFIQRLDNHVTIMFLPSHEDSVMKQIVKRYIFKTNRSISVKCRAETLQHILVFIKEISRFESPRTIESTLKSYVDSGISKMN